MKGHPVFITQNATATCCQGCLRKWHRIEKGRALKDDEIGFVVALVMGVDRWARSNRLGQGTIKSTE
jgi:hypothetical protein